MSLSNEGIFDMQNRRWKLSAISIAAALTIGILALFLSSQATTAPSTPSPQAKAAPSTPSPQATAAPSTPSPQAKAAPSTPSPNAVLTKPLLAIAAAIAIAGGLIG